MSTVLTSSGVALVLRPRGRVPLDPGVEEPRVHDVARELVAGGVVLPDLREDLARDLRRVHCLAGLP